jgi:serine/threonine protein phosphatase 1
LVDLPDSRKAAKLITLYNILAPRLRPKDKPIYLGNVIGRINGARETVDNLLRFRREYLSIPGNCVNDYNVLRGRHEEMPHKFLGLQFAIDPREVQRWTVGQGIGSVITAYRVNTRVGKIASAQGAEAIARWTQSLRATLNGTPGHRAYYLLKNTMPTQQMAHSSVFTRGWSPNVLSMLKVTDYVGILQDSRV